MLRTFFAIDLPQALQENVRGIIEQLNLHHKLMVRWSKSSHFHITLQFLKDVSSDDMALLIQNVRNELQDIPPFEIELGLPALFPDNNHPRVISLTILPTDTLIAISKRIGQGILATHYTIEARRYRPHMTLGRFTEKPLGNLSFENIHLSKPIRFLAKEIVFYQSLPSADGSHYIPLDRIKLS